MKKRTELDERQLWQRGNVFKHAFVFLIAALAPLAAGRGPLLEEGMLTSGGAITLTGCLMASILAVYLAKSFREKRRPAGDED